MVEEEILKHLKALEQRIVHLEQSVHPEQITKVVAQKIAMHLRGLTVGEHTSPPSTVHDHKP